MSEVTQPVKRTFRTVNGRPIEEKSSVREDGAGQTITYVRPSELAKNNTLGPCAEGVFEGAISDRFDDSKENYKIRANDGSLIIVNNSGSLASQMKRVDVGSYVIIEYLGQEAMAKGKFAGKKAHRFLVKIAE